MAKAAQRLGRGQRLVLGEQALSEADASLGAIGGEAKVLAEPDLRVGPAAPGHRLAAAGQERLLADLDEHLRHSRKSLGDDPCERGAPGAAGGGLAVEQGLVHVAGQAIDDGEQVLVIGDVGRKLAGLRRRLQRAGEIVAVDGGQGHDVVRVVALRALGEPSLGQGRDLGPILAPHGRLHGAAEAGELPRC